MYSKFLLLGVRFLNGPPHRRKLFVLAAKTDLIIFLLRIIFRARCKRKPLFASELVGLINKSILLKFMKSFVVLFILGRLIMSLFESLDRV